jgi:glycosyltransferase involved in cell wall biosynthesis
MNIVYFFTFGYSLNTWKNSGQLDRELEHFEFWKKINPDIKITVVTYGEENDLTLVKNEFIEVIPIYKYVKFSKFKIINLIKSFFIITILKNIIQGESYDLVIQNQLLGSWVSYQFKKLKKIPLIIRTGYDMYEFSKNENKSYAKQFFYRLITKKSLKYADLYTVTSECDKNFLIEQFGEIESSKIEIRKNWVSLNNANKLNSLEERYSKKIVCVGRIEDQKNYKTIINALKDTDFTVDIFGEGTEKNEITKLAKKQNVQIKFKGILDNNKLKELLTNYKYFLTASKFEGNPKSVLEAMSAGCLIIASDIKNHKEFLNNENSILFQDTNSLNKILKNLDKNRYDFKKITENSLQTIRENYAIENIAKLELNDIEKLLYSP